MVKNLYFIILNFNLTKWAQNDGHFHVCQSDFTSKLTSETRNLQAQITLLVGLDKDIEQKQLATDQIISKIKL
jgi:hypothetical protein